jgi:hypothetical protein
MFWWIQKRFPLIVTVTPNKYQALRLSRTRPNRVGVGLAPTSPPHLSKCSSQKIKNQKIVFFWSRSLGTRQALRPDWPIHQYITLWIRRMALKKAGHEAFLGCWIWLRITILETGLCGLWGRLKVSFKVIWCYLVFSVQVQLEGDSSQT